MQNKIELDNLNNLLISVIIPVKNGGIYLREALEGIQQQKLNTEIIVVDDASTDDTIEIATNFGCIVIKHEKSLGPVIAKNTALKVARGNYILFHDGDDFMNNGVLAKMYDELHKDKSLSAVMAKVKDFISPDTKENNTAQIKPEAYWGLFTGAILMKKEVFNEIGLFDESVTAGEIIDWQMKMKEKNLKIKKLDLISTNRRIHNTNFGRTSQNKEFKDYASLLRAKLVRK